MTHSGGDDASDKGSSSQANGAGRDGPWRDPPASRPEPIFNVPPMVLALLAIMLGVMAWRMFLSENADTAFVIALSLIPARLDGYAAELPGGDIAFYTQFITHMFVHGDGMHLAFNAASLLAFGGALEKRIGPWRLLLFFLGCGFAGAMTFILLNPGLMAPMIGASGAISGLMGGLMRLFFSAMEMPGGLRRLSDAPSSVPLMPLSVALRDRRLQIVTASFVVMNIAAMVGFGDINATNAIAWEAHIGGYIAGLCLFGFFDIAPRHSQSGEYPIA